MKRSVFENDWLLDGDSDEVYKKKQEIKSYIVKHTPLVHRQDASYHVDFDDGEYSISGDRIYLRLTRTNPALLYNIKKCNYICFYGDEINSCSNMPNRSYNGESLTYVFDTTNSINFTQLKPKSGGAYISLKIINVDYFDINNIQQGFNGVSIHLCKQTNANDFDKYKDVSFGALDIITLEKFRNLQNILYTNLFWFNIGYSEYGIYSSEQLKSLSKIIREFLDKNNREDYIMDMTLSLIDAGFENEVS